MSTDHPITPPPHDLVTEWEDKYHGHMPEWVLRHVATEAARWGADQELEACCEWLRSKDILEPAIEALRTARRPKPPSLKEEALKLVSDYGARFYRYSAEQTEIIRRALEQLDE